MKRIGRIAAMVAWLSVSTAWADQTIMYPTQENADFSVTVPDDWELTPAESKDDYFTVDGPTGASFSFRSLTAKSEKQAKKNLEDAIQESLDYLKEHFKDVQLGDPKDDKVGGMEGFAAVGSGADKESGEPVAFVMGWYFNTNKGKIIEVWFETAPDDKEGAEQASKIMDTLKP